MQKLKEVMIRKLTCLRCGHEWFPNKIAPPRACPSCHSPYWDRKRTFKIRIAKKRKKDPYRVSIEEFRRRLGITKLRTNIKITGAEEKRILALRAKGKERASLA